MGLYESAKKYVGWPITPGFEFSGTILSFGDGQEEHEVGMLGFVRPVPLELGLVADGMISKSSRA